MQRYIPGHIRGFTWILAVVTAGVAYLVTSRWSTVLGMVLIVAGGFLGDQATHLAQMDHAGQPPTWLERQQQQHRWLFVILGLLLAAAGAYLISQPSF